MNHFIYSWAHGYLDVAIYMFTSSVWLHFRFSWIALRSGMASWYNGHVSLRTFQTIFILSPLCPKLSALTEVPFSPQWILPSPLGACYVLQSCLTLRFIVCAIYRYLMLGLAQSHHVSCWNHIFWSLVRETWSSAHQPVFMRIPCQDLPGQDRKWRSGCQAFISVA